MNIKRFIKKLFGMRQDMSLGFYVTDFIFRKIFRQNASVSWAIHHTATIRCPEKIVKGEGSYPGDSPGVYINAFNGVVIGDYVNIASNVGIISANHDFLDNSKHVVAPPIRIGSRTWIGMNAVILPGVQLGSGTIVAAGAIVTKSFEEGNCVIGGNPAKVIKQIKSNTD